MSTSLSCARKSRIWSNKIDISAILLNLFDERIITQYYTYLRSVSELRVFVATAVRLCLDFCEYCKIWVNRGKEPLDLIILLFTADRQCLIGSVWIWLYRPLYDRLKESGCRPKARNSGKGRIISCREIWNTNYGLSFLAFFDYRKLSDLDTTDLYE